MGVYDRFHKRCLKGHREKNIDLATYCANLTVPYRAADPDKLMADEVRDISSFMTVDLSDGFIPLTDLSHASKPPSYSLKRREEEGLLTGVRLVETLARCGYLKSIQVDVKDNSRY